MQTVTVDLKKTPEIADAVAGMEPGSEVCLHATIKSLDDQSLVLTVEELSVPKDDERMPMGGNEGSDAAPSQGPSQSGMSDMEAEESGV